MKLHLKIILLFIFSVFVALNENFKWFGDSDKERWRWLMTIMYVLMLAYIHWLGKSYEHSDSRTYYTCILLRGFFLTQVTDCLLFNPYVFAPNDFIIIGVASLYTYNAYKKHKKNGKHDRQATNRIR